MLRAVGMDRNPFVLSPEQPAGTCPTLLEEKARSINLRFGRPEDAHEENDDGPEHETRNSRNEARHAGEST